MYKHCLQLLLGVKTEKREREKRNWKKCLCKILGWQTKIIMVYNGILWSGQFRPPVTCDMGIRCPSSLFVWKTRKKKAWSQVRSPVVRETNFCYIVERDTSKKSVIQFLSNWGQNVLILALSVNFVSFKCTALLQM